MAGGLAVADLDLSGAPDLVSASANALTVHRNAGDGQSWLEMPIASFPASTLGAQHVVSVADFDFDEVPDVAVSSFLSAGIRWYPAPGFGFNGFHQLTEAFGLFLSGTIGDVDGDGDPDAVGVTATGSGILWYENLDPYDVPWTAHTIDPAAAMYGSDLAVRDVDGDGDADVVSGGGWFENTNGSGTAWTTHAVADGDLALATEAADLDGDGDADLVVGQYDGRVDWYENTAGDGSTWTRRVLAGSDGSSLGEYELAGELDAVDLDADGDLDVLAAFEASLRWLENRASDGSAWAPWTLAATGLGRTIEAADLDGDGDLDGVGGDAAAAGILRFENLGATCGNQVDNDGDGLADFGADPGCNSAADSSERSPALACDDGSDNDGDGLSDYLADPGCKTVSSAVENPKCDDDLDNDGDGRIDANGPGLPDPQCTKPWQDAEKAASACGLGAELALLLPLLQWLRRRATRGRRVLSER